MPSDEPLDTALADAVVLGQLPLGRTRGEGCDKPFRVDFTQPVTDSPLTGAVGGAYAERRFAGLSLRLPELVHRADQRVCAVPAV
jgi:hypothetical protein